MHRCNNCGSTNVKNLGLRFYGKKKVNKFQCDSCKTVFTKDWEKPIDLNKNIVVSSIIDGFEINYKFLNALKFFCEQNNADLYLLPVNHGKPFNEFNYPDDIKTHILTKNIVHDSILIMGSLKLGSTLENPLYGLTPLSKGKSLIFGHPQVQLKTVAHKENGYPPILCTTGTISIAEYTENKTNLKANFNHSFSAVFITNNDIIRHLNFDGIGFYDLNFYYDSKNKTQIASIPGIVTGDEHVIFYDDDVYEATYGENGIINTLKPEYIVRHDVLDCFTISHHHNRNILVQYGKYLSKDNSIENEMRKTIEFLINTTPSFSKSIIVSSNHNNHLTKWLNEADIKKDMVNIKLYHQLMWMVLDNIDTNSDGSLLYPNPFELWARYNYDLKNVIFLSSSEMFDIKGIDVSNHGDKGINGTKGTRLSYRDMAKKTVVGHSHSPGIEKGTYQVGTSSKLRLEYNDGLSSWHHCHCLIHPNGKRQLVFIKDGKWQ